jgi:hypothetical protein
MVKKFEHKIYDESNWKKSQYLKTRDISIRMTNKTKLNLLDLKNMARSVLKNAQKKDKNARIAVRGKSNLRDMTTISGFKDDIENMYESEQEYLGVRIKSDTKFLEYFQATFTIIYDPRLNK